MSEVIASTAVSVRFRIPLSREGRFNADLMFTRWLPVDAASEIVFSENGCTARLYVNESCIPQRIYPTEVHNHVNLFVTHVIVEVATTVAAILADFILGKRELLSRFPSTEFSDDLESTLAHDYADLARRIVSIALKLVNRVITFVRNRKGQYWLEPLDIPINDVGVHSAHLRFGAQVRIAESEWFRWSPPGTFMITAGPLELARYVGEEDWDDLRSFVVADARPELFLELLANAESLAVSGRRRSALIEAVSALELALADFARQPQELPSWGMVSQRVPVKSLASQVEHMGPSGSMRYLIPFLFQESALPTEVLELCWAAIDMRQTVVHAGQRDVPEARLSSFLPAIRSASLVLRGATATKGSS